MCPTVATTAESSRPQAVATNSSTWEFEGLEKAMPLSQSSETNRTLNAPSTAGLADGTTRFPCLACKDKPAVVLTEVSFQVSICLHGESYPSYSLVLFLNVT
jgi:hypothetical protein